MIYCKGMGNRQKSLSPSLFGKETIMETRPLADLLRPREFNEMVGQKHLFGKNGVVTAMCQRGYITNMIFFGPPGTGKTTAANIIAEKSGMTIHRLNATTASLADIKAVIAESGSLFGNNGTLLYLDEIQYFNKKQQQSLLEFMESGQITLIASTTENPYMYVYNAILSRSAVFEFKPVSAEDVKERLIIALARLNAEQKLEKAASDETLLAIASAACGDVRRAINLLENLYFASESEITKETLAEFTPKTVGNFDKDGTMHYDLISALQKSVRGSDPDAAVFYLARLLEGGDLIGACRRISQMANEDIGLAYPMAAAITDACVNTALRLGMPEASAPLSNCIIMLATAPKSNSAMEAYFAAKEAIEAGKGQAIPSHLRQTELFNGYKYPHDHPGHWVKQDYLPKDLAGTHFYRYGENKTEQAAREYWKKIKGE